MKKKDKLQSMVPITAPNLNKLFDSKRDADKARVLLQHLFHVRRQMKKNPNFAPGLDRRERWCPIVSRNIKALVWDYGRIRDKLIEAGVIEFKKNQKGAPSYFPGMYSMLYRVVFPKNMLASGVPKYRREYVTTPELIKIVGKYHARRYEKQRARLLASTAWYEPCLEFMEGLTLEATEEDLQQVMPERVINQRLVYQEQFNLGLNRHVSRCEYGRRIHSFVSHLPKCMRPFLKTADNSELIMIDVKNSQPYFISLFCLHPGIVNTIPEFEPIKDVLNTYAGRTETRLFHEDCRRGLLYDKLADSTGLKRKEIKDMLFEHVLFAAPYWHSKNEDLGRTRRHARWIFSSQYRDVLVVLDKLKRTRRAVLPFVYDMTVKVGKDGRKYSKMYSTPNMMAQRLESFLLLDMITKLAVDQGIKICTIHDAWLLREQDLNGFMEVFSGVFEYLGISPPTLEVDKLNPVT